MYGDIYCTDIIYLSYTFTLSFLFLEDLVICCKVTLLPCYSVTLLPCYSNNNNNNNISKAPFPNGPKALFTRLKIQIYNKTLIKLKEVKS